MACTWNEELAYKYSERTLEPATEAEFSTHLACCPTCRARVEAAEQIDSLLKGSLTPVAVPATLVGRVAQAAAQEGEAKRACFPWPRLFGRRALATVLTSLLLALGLILISDGGESVKALMQRALFWVPGIGINQVDDGYLVATQPVVLRDGNMVFTVQTLLSDGETTTLRFTLTGLPGDKAGWERAGQSEERPKSPFLRDEQGREYSLTSSWYGTGGTPEEATMSGGMNFAPLAEGVAAVDLVVPQDYLVPPAVVPGTNEKEWVARITLANPAESGLPQAVAQNAAVTVDDVTLHVTASSANRDRTVVALQSQVPGPKRVASLDRPGADPDKAVVLRDDKGRTYKQIREQSGVTFGNNELNRSLSFEPLVPGATQLTLSVAAVQVLEEGTAEVTIPLAGRGLDEQFVLDQTVMLGEHPLKLKTAKLVEIRAMPGVPSDQPQRELALAIEVDLGPREGARTFSAFSVDGPGGYGITYDEERTQVQILHISGLEPGQQEVTLRLTHPMVVVEGPFEITFPVEGVDDKQ